MISKHILLFGVTVSLVLSCANETISENAVSDDRVSVLSEDDAVAEEGGNSVIEVNEIWQISDYTSFLLNENIHENAEDLNTSGGEGYYFEELDEKGGFARVTGFFEGFYEFVLWRMDDGNDLVGKMIVGCGPVCSYEFNFFVGKGNQIEEVALEQIFPIDEMNAHRDKLMAQILEENEEWLEYPEDVQLVFNFPQSGTAMNVDLVVGADEIQTKLLKLSWDKQKFHIEELYEIE